MRSQWAKVVVAIGDPYRRTNRALRKGAQIAGRSGARLELVHTFAAMPRAFGGVLPAGVGAPHAGLSRGDRRKQLERLAAPLRRRGLEVETTVVWDMPPHEALVRHVRNRRADLLVADSRRHGRLSRWFLTNTDWELIRNCPCPLWFVKSAALPRAVRILAAVDPMHASAKPARLDDRILQAATDLRKILGGSVAMCHVALPPFIYEIGGVYGEPIPVPLPPDQQRRHEARIAKAMNALAKRYRIPPQARVLTTGEPSHVLPQIARRRSADLLVMGAVSRSGFNRLLIGSTAERVIDDVDCDVLVIKPAGFRSAVPRARRRDGIVLA